MSTEPVDLPESVVDELPPSALLVYVALRTEQPQRTTELAEWTGMPVTTVRSALARLREHDIVCQLPVAEQGNRSCEYLLVEPHQ